MPRPRLIKVGASVLLRNGVVTKSSDCLYQRAVFFTGEYLSALDSI